jgi:transcriptional regulator with GAF, ATPase, and Fis domain
LSRSIAGDPEYLSESLLLGHEKGAFTGASDKHLGKFQEADGGTLFLDEIGELRLDMQVKLLRALQEGEIDPVGAKRPVKVDVRIISATNRDLAELTREGRFREDLYYRLNVFPVLIPPLRDRREDVPALAEYFVTRFAAEENKQVSGFTPEALALLDSYGWPGNVRQLENTIFRAVVLCDTDALDVVDFPQIASAMGVSQRERALAPAGAPLPGRSATGVSSAAPRCRSPYAIEQRMGSATCASSKTSRPKSSGWRSHAMRGGCRKSPGGWVSGARRSTASSRTSVWRTAPMRHPMKSRWISLSP